MIIKCNPLEFKNKQIIHPILRNETELSIIDYRLRCRKNNIIPINFLNKIIFVNKNSFIQNNKYVGNNIRKYVIQNINNNNNNKIIITIGGESYNYLFFFPKIIGYFYTNNKNIFNDFNHNNKINNSKLQGYLIDYNKNIIFNNFVIDYVIINLSKLNTNILKQLNKLNIKNIIIINCYHNDFWKKIKYLTNFKLINRKQFIDEKIKYFITVNIFTPLNI